MHNKKSLVLDLIAYLSLLSWYLPESLAQIVPFFWKESFGRKKKMHKKVLRHKYHMKLLGEMFVRKKYKY